MFGGTEVTNKVIAKEQIYGYNAVGHIPPVFYIPENASYKAAVT